jgi:hypothetical protein
MASSARVMPYQFLHSPRRESRCSTPASDRRWRLDRLRRRVDEVRAAVGALQRILYDNPPGVFIAWDERARAVSRRFVVPSTPGRDILSTFWQVRPAGGAHGN